MKSLIKIGKAAELLGTTPATLRLWESTGELIPDRKTDSGTRYYDIDKIKPDHKDYESIISDLKEALELSERLRVLIKSMIK